MTWFYEDYFWDEAVPMGIRRLELEQVPDKALVYKLASDPYGKWRSIEKYVHGAFDSVVYDSLLFDFRHLKPENQIAWEKEVLSECGDKSEILIRDQNDRVVLHEEYLFDQHLCRKCHVSSAHHVPISDQKMFYTFLGDKADILILYDMAGHPIMYKQYQSLENGEYGKLVEENWKMQNFDLEKVMART